MLGADLPVAPVAGDGGAAWTPQPSSWQMLRPSRSQRAAAIPAGNMVSSWAAPGPRRSVGVGFPSLAGVGIGPWLRVGAVNGDSAPPGSAEGRSPAFAGLPPPQPPPTRSSSIRPGRSQTSSNGRNHLRHCFVAAENLFAQGSSAGPTAPAAALRNARCRQHQCRCRRTWA